MGVKSKVLIIDDDVKTVEKLKEMLSDYPDLYVAAHAPSLAEGERLLSEVEPTCCFSTLSYPTEMDWSLSTL